MRITAGSGDVASLREADGTRVRERDAVRAERQVVEHERAARSVGRLRVEAVEERQPGVVAGPIAGVRAAERSHERRAGQRTTAGVEHRACDRARQGEMEIDVVEGAGCEPRVPPASERMPWRVERIDDERLGKPRSS